MFCEPVNKMGDGQQIRGEEPGVGSDARQSPIPPSSLLEPKEAVTALAGDGSGWGHWGLLFT